MGYYSEIGFCLNKSAHDKMLQHLSLQVNDVQVAVQELLASAEIRIAHQGTHAEATLYHWPWIKWYDHFTEVKFIASLIDQIGDDDEAEMQYRFVIIGEELEDITAHGSYHENPFAMDVSRGVYINEAYTIIAKALKNKE